MWSKFLNKILENLASTKIWVLTLATIFFFMKRLEPMEWLIVAGSFLPIRILEYLAKRNNGSGAK